MFNDGESDSQSCSLMQHWFEDELFPMMLECERKVESSLPNNETSNVGEVVYHRSDRRVVVERTYDGAYSSSENPMHLYSEESYKSESSKNIEELHHFLKKSAEHQKHMEVVRKLRREAESKYVPDTQGPIGIPPRSDTAPLTQPHRSRFDALQSLYGDNANQIIAMETNLQSRFDRSVEMAQPRYWPIIALKL